MIDAEPLIVERSLSAGPRPAALAVSPDGQRVYVVNSLANGEAFVAVLAVATGQVVAQMPLGEGVLAAGHRGGYR